MRQKILIAGLLLLILGIIGASFVSTVQAQGGANTDRGNSAFCGGTREWVFDGQALDENVAPCGGAPDSFKIVLYAPWEGSRFNPNYKETLTWREAVRFLHNNGYTNGSMWVVGSKGSTTFTQPSGGQTGNAPAGFCLGGGIAWQIQGPASDPQCTGGQYALDLGNGNVQRNVAFAYLESLRAGKQGTYFYEPGSSAPAGQITPAITDINALVNWPNWCQNVSPFVFSAGGVLNVGSFDQLKPPCTVTQIVVLEPWRPGCTAPHQDVNTNCRAGHAFLFSTILEAKQWLLQQSFTEGSVWNIPGGSGGGGKDVCVRDIAKPGTAILQLPGSSDPCLNPNPAQPTAPPQQPTTAPLVPTSIPQPLPSSTPVPGPTGTSVPGPTGTPIPPKDQNPPPVVGGGILDYWWVLICCLGVLLLLVLGYAGYRFLKGRGSDEDEEQAPAVAPARTTRTTTSTTTTP